MPQLDVYNASSYPIDFTNLFKSIEDTILDLDSSAGKSKSRGHTIEAYSMENIFINIGLLEKTYRDKNFTDKLTKDILNSACEITKDKVLVSVNIYFLSQSYESSYGHIR